MVVKELHDCSVDGDRNLWQPGHREEGKKSQEQRRPSKSTSVETVILSDALRSVIIIFYELELLNRIFLCRLLGTWGDVPNSFNLGTRQL